MIRVLVADDEALVRGGVRMILDVQPDIDVVGESVDGLDAVTRAAELRPDLVLMDIRMPGLDGIEATRRILRLPQPPRVVLLTTFDLDEYVYDAMRAGASGFVLKSTPPEQLVAGLRLVAGGEALVSPVVTRRLVERFVRAPRPDVEPAAVRGLTGREIDVLRLIAQGSTNGEIAAALHLSLGTVKTHINHILRKLDLRDRVHAVVLAYECGLVRPGDPETPKAGLWRFPGLPEPP